MRSSLVAAFAVAALTVACSTESGPPASDIVGSIPWFRQESQTYVLKDGNGNVVGRQVLGIEVLNGETVLTQHFTGEQSSDKTTVSVDSVTLKPTSSTREIAATDDDVLIEVTYGEDGVSIREGDKQTGMSVPEHSYDNDTSLFIWRTLPFEIGYEGSYITLITNQRSTQKVNLLVSGRETVTVPAGEFVAWRLEISTTNAKQVAWYADVPERTLVRYDNSRGLVFELDSAPDTAVEPSP